MCHEGCWLVVGMMTSSGSHGEGAKDMTTLMQKLTNPLAMLRADHAYVKQAFASSWVTDSFTVRRLLVQEICGNLTIHATLEEELFYPALEQFGGLFSSWSRGELRRFSR